MIPRTPGIFSLLFPKILFRVKPFGAERVVYLTFDDGPNPEATGFVLDCLAKYNAKATFFTVGENVDRYPETMQRIKQEGHVIGHHTNKHLNALHTPKAEYLADVEIGASKSPSSLFRPPYGKLTLPVYQALKNKYRIVLWDVLSEDYDENYTAEACIEKVLRQIRPGSIVVLHDNPKCLEKVKVILPKILESLKESGFSFRAL
jgi:peptidoglycan/xylan/chitin deacetylase (PgdA/CDA1 family)